MSNKQIRYDEADDMILIPYPGGCGDYEIERWRFSDREAIEMLVDELSDKKWIRVADVRKVQRLAESLLPKAVGGK